MLVDVGSTPWGTRTIRADSSLSSLVGDSPRWQYWGTVNREQSLQSLLECWGTVCILSGKCFVVPLTTLQHFMCVIYNTLVPSYSSYPALHIYSCTKPYYHGIIPIILKYKLSITISSFNPVQIALVLSRGMITMETRDGNHGNTWHGNHGNTWPGNHGNTWHGNAPTRLC